MWKVTDQSMRQTVSPQKQGNVTAEMGTIDYWKQVTDAQIKNSKPKNAVAVIEQIEKNGEQGIPNQLREIVKHALDLAGETG